MKIVLSSFYRHIAKMWRLLLWIFWQVLEQSTSSNHFSLLMEISWLLFFYLTEVHSSLWIFHIPHLVTCIFNWRQGSLSSSFRRLIICSWNFKKLYFISWFLSCSLCSLGLLCFNLIDWRHFICSWSILRRRLILAIRLLTALLSRKLILM